MALKLSGAAAKNFALFVYAVLKDQKKTHGKTRLVRMLREQRPFKFFNVPTENMKEFATEAKTHGLLYVPIRNKQKADRIEVVVFADDASKVQRIFDNLGLDAVKAQAGEATIANVQEKEKQAPAAPAPGKTKTVKTEQGEVEFEVGGFEDDFNIAPPQQDAAENFTSGREKEAGEPAERNPSAPSSPSKSSSPNSINPKEPEHKPSVKQQLQEIRQEQAEKKASKSKQQERQHPTPGHAKQKKKKKQKGR
ncbi:PcfB family protein [Anaeromassilibacillus sp. Marseille-P3371]|uniref:PcfB family protein n=1 Tax=Anaeromassilibacillus sp. Marseille-P3371 TaxID=1944639 RepID=UPI000A1C9D48|nr:PcfB family protein [Anaeromassilibacillus sp. Marseille-P3371]